MVLSCYHTVTALYCLTELQGRLTKCHLGHSKLQTINRGKVTLEISDPGSKFVKRRGHGIRELQPLLIYNLSEFHYHNSIYSINIRGPDSRF